MRNDDINIAMSRNAELRRNAETDRKEIDKMTKSLDENVRINGFSQLIYDAMKRRERGRT